MAVPDSTPVEARVTPTGRGPVSVNVGAGAPLAVATNDRGVPAVNVAEAGDVNDGATCNAGSSTSCWWPESTT